jgi:hypothetical protein
LPGPPESLMNLPFAITTVPPWSYLVACRLCHREAPDEPRIPLARTAS